MSNEPGSGRRPALSELIAKVNKLPRFVTPEGGACVNLTAVQLILAALPASSEGAHGWQDYVQHKPECRHQQCARCEDVSFAYHRRHELGTNIYRHDFVACECTCGLDALLTPSTPEDQ
jgi:hypothetical protein